MMELKTCFGQELLLRSVNPVRSGVLLLAIRVERGIVDEAELQIRRLKDHHAVAVRRFEAEQRVGDAVDAAKRSFPFNDFDTVVLGGTSEVVRALGLDQTVNAEQCTGTDQGQLLLVAVPEQLLQHSIEEQFARQLAVSGLGPVRTGQIGD